MQVGKEYSVFALNIQNAGMNRIEGIFNLLKNTNPDIIALSELKNKPSTEVLFEKLHDLGYISTPIFDSRVDVYHSAVLSRIKFKNLKVETPVLKNRVKVTKFNMNEPNAYLLIISVYGFAHNLKNSDDRKNFKSAFEERILNRLNGRNHNVIILGDLNILEKQFHDTFPNWVIEDAAHFNHFRKCHYIDYFRKTRGNEAGYTWYSPRTGIGQRLDYIFSSEAICSSITTLDIHHELRLQKISDHSGLSLRLRL